MKKKGWCGGKGCSGKNGFRGKKRMKPKKSPLNREIVEVELGNRV